MSNSDQLAQARAIFWNPIRESGVTCEVCAAPTDGYLLCYACNAHANAQFPTANVVAPLTYAVKGEQSYKDLTVYKNAEYGIAVRGDAIARIRSVVFASLSQHLRCVAELAGTEVVIASVPSTSGQRTGPHPLEQILSLFGPSLPRTGLTYVGEPGLERNARRKFLPESFRVDDTEAIRARHVLLMDDAWVQGGHLQSAAAALRLAGAAYVTAMPIARVLAGDFGPTANFLGEHKRRVFDPAICPLTGRFHS